MKKKLSAIILTGALALTTACGSSTGDTASAPETAEATTAQADPGDTEAATTDNTEESTAFSFEGAEKPTFDLESSADPAAFTGKGMKTAFVTDIDFDEEIRDADMASMAIYNNMDKIGAGDGSVVLQYDSTRPTETGITYYTFNQVNNYVRVYGSSVKLIVDKNGKAIGMVSAVVPGIKEPDNMNANLTAEDAEAIVREKYKGEKINVVPGVSEEVLLPAEDGSEIMYYAWAVYTWTSSKEYDTPYLAHYVSKSGAYLYSIPVSEPGTIEAAAGNIAAFAFDGGTPGTLDATITYSDGSTKDVTLPVIIDENGQALLADSKRKILCADYADFNNNETLTPVKCGENDTLVNSQLTDYYHFICVYDFFDELGWTGPDGDGTPSLLLMNMVDNEGNPVDNAYYQGKSRGFQVFNFSDIYNYGETLDIMAHEFTHCLTDTTMTTNLYLNDMGAINEGMSDVIGNLVSILIDGYTDHSWQIGDPAKILRSMNDPHKYNQPEYVGDRYYLSDVASGSGGNDNGGVHINSSLLNLISWYLDEAGMEPADQLYFWMNVSMAMTPRTDYPQMAELLPWEMKNLGYSQHVAAVEDAIRKTRIGLGEDPQNVPEGCGKVRFKYDFNEIQNYDTTVDFISTDKQKNENVKSWPSASTNWVSTVLPEGDYVITICFTPKSSTGETKSEESGNTETPGGDTVTPGEESGDAETPDEEGQSAEVEEAPSIISGIYTEQGWYLLDYADLEDVIEKYGNDLDMTIEAGKVIDLETESLAAAIEQQ
ncbi:MAG: M4 family metallopeptidase [Eubacterium sp.]|nr:M4 family metallopeptidase [Eubacterium sp.]